MSRARAGNAGSRTIARADSRVCPGNPQDTGASTDVDAFSASRHHNSGASCGMFARRSTRRREPLEIEAVRVALALSRVAESRDVVSLEHGRFP